MKSVKVNGRIYTIVDSRNFLTDHWSGKGLYLLRDADGNHFTAYGKRVAHNSRLTEVNPAEFAADKAAVAASRLADAAERQTSGRFGY